MADPVSHVARTCQCWVLTRRDGEIVRVSEHDRPLAIAGQIFSPGAAIEASSFTATSDLSPGHASITGALSSDAISDDDIASGAWDGARVDVYRADWERAEMIDLIWSGRFTSFEQRGAAYSADLVSLKIDLERLVGRAYLRSCDAVLGDGRCGVDLTHPSPDGLVCDQSFATCQTVFNNTDNFRGFPHMPGTDFILSGPAAAESSA